MQAAPDILLVQNIWTNPSIHRLAAALRAIGPTAPVRRSFMRRRMLDPRPRECMTLSSRLSTRRKLMPHAGHVALPDFTKNKISFLIIRAYSVPAAVGVPLAYPSTSLTASLRTNGGEKIAKTEGERLPFKR